MAHQWLVLLHQLTVSGLCLHSFFVAILGLVFSTTELTIYVKETHFFLSLKEEVVIFKRNMFLFFFLPKLNLQMLCSARKHPTPDKFQNLISSSHCREYPQYCKISGQKHDLTIFCLSLTWTKPLTNCVAVFNVKKWDSFVLESNLMKVFLAKWPADNEAVKMGKYG